MYQEHFYWEQTWELPWGYTGCIKSSCFIYFFNNVCCAAMAGAPASLILSGSKSLRQIHLWLNASSVKPPCYTRLLRLYCERVSTWWFFFFFFVCEGVSTAKKTQKPVLKTIHTYSSLTFPSFLSLLSHSILHHSFATPPSLSPSHSILPSFPSFLHSRPVWFGTWVAQDQ